ncbi:HdeD family acid-resistance protein [Feifania hominis]|uniref:DUF308 domain-containing protein n=1 Tax=Feifania hominis TaxID=2763660 RepID=A0A926DG07_9FIRM|nr:DUF308 domain-containing protein [Feifania hominis]MBC8537176.1 DUF308 domain-containing protein [Feifania hominis]
MRRVEANFDFAREIAARWNKKLKSVRIASFVISVLMVVCAVLCMVFPVQSVVVAEILAAVVIIALGVYECVDYFCAPAYLREAGVLVSGILNAVLGVMLLCSPRGAAISSFAFLFGVVMMVLGVDKIALAGKLSYFAVTGYGWVVASGVLNVLGAVAFFVAPFFSTLVLHAVIAGYLLIDGVTLFIEAISMKDLKIR